MQRFHCIACLFPYDERAGLPDDGIPPGTQWKQVPEHWRCPDCGRPKSGFVNSAA